MNTKEILDTNTKFEFRELAPNRKHCDLEMWDSIENFIACKIKEAKRDAVREYDKALFTDDSCYKIDSYWGRIRKQALAKFGIEEDK